LDHFIVKNRAIYFHYRQILGGRRTITIFKSFRDLRIHFCEKFSSKRMHFLTNSYRCLWKVVTFEYHAHHFW